jgi:hypothetical protein
MADSIIRKTFSALVLGHFYLLNDSILVPIPINFCESLIMVT